LTLDIVDHGDCDVANNNLAGLVRNGAILNGRAGLFNVAGSAIAFVINNESRAEVIGSDIVSRGSGAVTNACGWYIAGTWQVDGYDHVDYGYMNYFSGLDIFGAAESSGQHSCH
jgi:hypothetical protein